MSIALKPGFQSLATLKFVVNVGRLLNHNEELRHHVVSLLFVLTLFINQLLCCSVCVFSLNHFVVISL